MFDAQYFSVVVLVLVIALVVSMFRVLREYERGLSGYTYLECDDAALD